MGARRATSRAAPGTQDRWDWYGGNNSDGGGDGETITTSLRPIGSITALRMEKPLVRVLDATNLELQAVWRVEFGNVDWELDMTAFRDKRRAVSALMRLRDRWVELAPGG